jgi:hypothetical protein
MTVTPTLMRARQAPGGDSRGRCLILVTEARQKNGEPDRAFRAEPGHEKLTEACAAGKFGEVPTFDRKPHFPDRKEKTMKREDLINRLAARRLLPAGSKAKPTCGVCFMQPNVKK